MKKELLRINRLNYNYTRTRKLENVSFCILEGECIGFLGLSYSGKDLMTSLLRGELTEGDGSGAIYLGGQKVNDWEVLGKEIYYMCPDNYVIEDWTVAEYLCLVDSGWAGSFWRKGVLNEEAGECFAELELDFDISSRMRDLSELEKRIVDVVKAYRKGARIIIIEDEFDGVSQTDIIKFGKIIRRLIQRKLGVIVNSNSNFIMSELSDKFIIFDRGHVVKKCAREYIKNEAQLERFLLGEDWPMNSIAASVIGGVALTGGVGNPAGALIGAAVITIIQNIIVLFGVNSYWQSAVSGIVVVLAISFSSISTIVRENRQKRIKLN